MDSLDKLNAWKQANPDRVKEGTKERVKNWRKNNPEKYKAQIERNVNSSRERRAIKHKSNKEKIRNNYLIVTYGINLEDYNSLLIKQNNCCSICKKNKCSTKKSFAVDHCHETKTIRGLLCKDCNIGLGMFKDNIEIMEIAIKYLKDAKID